VVLVFVLAGVMAWGGVALATGGGWGREAQQEPAGRYRDTSVTSAPALGDCLNASWSAPDQPFQGTVALRPADCAKVTVDAQIVDLVPVDSPAELSRAEARKICSRRTAGLRATLPDPVSYPLVPNREGDDLLCALFLRDARFYGPLGDFRHYGDEIGLTNTSAGDCFDIPRANEWRLVDCDAPHAQQAIAWKRLPAEVAYGRLAQEASCAEYADAWADAVRGREVFAWYSREEARWTAGFHFVLCVVKRAGDGERLPAGAIVPTGSTSG
jgi:hypothetical protein